LGLLTLDLIKIWNYVTSALSQIKMLIIYAYSFVGVIGFSLTLAAMHDALFFVSSYIFLLYSCYAKTYSVLLGMFKTLFELFRGKKFNIIRKKVDQ